MSKENEAMKERIRELDAQNRNLMKAVFEIEQCGMKNDIIVCDIPVSSNLKTFEKYWSRTHNFDICITYRLGVTKGIPPIAKLNKSNMVKLAREVELQKYRHRHRPSTEDIHERASLKVHLKSETKRT